MRKIARNDMITVYMYTGENEIVSQENVDIFKIAADS